MRLILLLAMGLSSFMMTGCATVSGIGQDFQSLGRGVSHLANEVRDEFRGRDTTTAAQRTTAPTRYAQPRISVYQPYSYTTATQIADDAHDGVQCDPYGDELSGGDLPACRSYLSDQQRY